METEGNFYCLVPEEDIVFVLRDEGNAGKGTVIRLTSGGVEQNWSLKFYIRYYSRSVIDLNPEGE